jgi:tetratricopeptide (TPR) repeat protein
MGTAILTIACSALPCLAQSHAASPTAKVAANSLPVYAQMDTSSSVVETLKKGQALALNFQIAGADGSWCNVRLPKQSATLGFVSCAGLKITWPRPIAESRAAYPAEDSTETNGNSRRKIRVKLPAPVARFLSSYQRITAQVVSQGELNGLALEKLDAAARGGSPAALDRAALGHLAAGHFQLAHSDTSDAIDQFRSAVALARDNPEIRLISLIDLAYVHLLRSEYSAALGPLDRASALAPNSAGVARLTGWAYYGLDQTGKAISEWKRAQRLQPDAQIAALLAKAERDQQAERNFHEDANGHFILRYEGGEAPELASRILNTLDADFATLQQDFQYTPTAPIGVVLYTQKTFRNVTRAPSWADGLYDGRIRVPVQGLTSVSNELAQVLMHELTHSFVRQMTDGRCPTWLNEGIAQYMEGWRSAGSAKMLVALYDEKKFIPLNRLEGPWTGFPAPIADYAYAWSLATVESIIANSGMWGIRSLFTEFRQGVSARTALGVALQLNYSDLELQTVQFLRRTYLQ